jgi:putative transposase
MHRSLEGIINTVTVKRECSKWYAVFSNTTVIEPLPVSNREVGIDVGLNSFAVTSDGEFIDNPRYFKNAAVKLRKIQRSVSRKKKGGCNRRKAARLLAKQHLRIKNQRKDFTHKLADSLVNTYGKIAVEDLRIKNMVKNHHLAQSISDAGWGKFIGILSYKAEYAGREFVSVNPTGTSQICSGCGSFVPKSLSVRVHNCPCCGVSLDRDLNSALNILALGRSVWDVTWEIAPSVSQEAVCFS